LLIQTIKDLDNKASAKNSLIVISEIPYVLKNYYSINCYEGCENVMCNESEYIIDTINNIDNNISPEESKTTLLNLKNLLQFKRNFGKSHRMLHLLGVNMPTKNYIDYDDDINSFGSNSDCYDSDSDCCNDFDLDCLDSGYESDCVAKGIKKMILKHKKYLINDPSDNLCE